MKSWKTTLIGAITAVVTAVWPIIQTGSIDWKNLGYAAAIALFAYFVKDHDVTGTSK